MEKVEDKRIPRKELIGKKITVYKLPLIERLGYYRPVILFFFLFGLNLVISLPFLIIYYKLWYVWLCLLPLLTTLIVAIVNLVRFNDYVAKTRKIIDSDTINEHHYDNFSGAPGTGKTFTGTYITYERAKKNWEDLEFEYWLICSERRKKNYEPSEDDKEIIESYEFYSKNDGIPCMCSNIPVYSKEYRRFSYDLGVEGLRQEVNVPFKSAWLLDEIGTVCSTDLQYAKRSNINGATDMDDMFRFCRVFREINLIGCEQDYNNIYIGGRRVASENRVYYEREWVLKPRFWFWLYNKLKKYFINRMWVHQSYMFAGFMKKLRQYIFACGFFKFTYSVRGNTQTQARVGKSEVNSSETRATDILKERGVLYIPCANSIKYRSRVLKSAYKAKDLPITLKPFISLNLADDKARSMLRSENLVPVKSK